MNKTIGLLTAYVLLCGATENVPAADRPLVFKTASQNFGLSVGQDDKVYVYCESMILQCDRDGGGQVGMPVVTREPITGVVGNRDGVIAVGYAHIATNVLLFDKGFNLANRFSDIGFAGFRSPAGVAAGPSGDFYVLDEGRDQIVRIHPDGIRCGIYKVPRRPADPKEPGGELAHFRVCEKNQTIYVVNRLPVIRCLRFDAGQWEGTCQELWEVKTDGSLKKPSGLYYGYGGFDVDENGILYVLGTFDSGPKRPYGLVKRYDRDGKAMKDLSIAFGDDLKPSPEKYVWGICVSKDELFVHRFHPSEMYQRYSLKTGQKLSVVSGPRDYSAITKSPKPAVDAKPIKPTASDVGLPRGRRTLRVLFIGNSQFHCVGDIPDTVEHLSRSATDTSAPIILAEEVLIGGTGLEGFWNDGLAARRIAAGGWDWVVIHDIVYSYGSNSDKFKTYAGKFAEAARKAGAKVLFVATGEVETAKDKAGVMYQDAAAMARQSKGARVAGAGMSWRKAWALDPKLDFWYTDRAHPSAVGYYVNACVIYAALTDHNPGGLAPYCDNIEKRVITKGEAAILQKAAWQAVPGRSKKRKGRRRISGREPASCPPEREAAGSGIVRRGGSPAHA